MTSEIFNFLLNFAVVLGNMASNLWQFLNETITIDNLDIPVWGLLGSGTIILIILLKIIKGIIL